MSPLCFVVLTTLSGVSSPCHLGPSKLLVLNGWDACPSTVSCLLPSSCAMLHQSIHFSLSLAAHLTLHFPGGTTSLVSFASLGVFPVHFSCVFGSASVFWSGFESF